MSIDWSEVVPDLARRRVVLVIGSGISRHSTGAAGKRPPHVEGVFNSSSGRLSR